MARPQPPIPVKLFVAAIFADESLLPELRDILIEHFGDIDYTSPVYPFRYGAYYADEMGEPLYRIFYSFRQLIDPAELREVKLATNEIEDRLAIEGRRRVNLDPGYIDFGKLVLASMKCNNQKVYLGKGVWADINLLYEKGHFRPLEWTFPDFLEQTYEKTLLHIRAKYKANLRAIQKADNEHLSG